MTCVYLHVSLVDAYVTFPAFSVAHYIHCLAYLGHIEDNENHCLRMHRRVNFEGFSKRIIKR